MNTGGLRQPARQKGYGYTLIELLMVLVLISVLAGVFINTTSTSFTSYYRLKLAASELSGAIAKARDTAAKNITIDNDCSIVQTIDTVTTDITTSLAPANCIATTLLPNPINLKVRSGASKLVLEIKSVFPRNINPNTNIPVTSTITFRSEGMSTNANSNMIEEMIMLSDPQVNAAICINLTIPTSIIRQGLIKSGSSNCDYTAK